VLPFEASRRLTGANLFFASCGAQLETQGIEPDAVLIEDWRVRVARARQRLGWPAGALVARFHMGGVSLALAAPIDGLLTATEVNEWALCAALLARQPAHWGQLEAELAAEALANADDPASVVAPVLEESAALRRLALLAAREARPDLRALLGAAAGHALPYVLDDEILTVGAGSGGVDLAVSGLPTVGDIDWRALHDIPTALVTGSNGKTTSVRLLAACLEAHGLPAAYCCTDGVFLCGTALANGDYSGPVGARTVLRARAARAAIIETARGGILRRGIAVSHAHVALVTNVSADHFGEYGIDDLEGLADVKLAVAGVLDARDLLVLNADDALLVAKASELPRRFGVLPRLGWFALDAEHALLRAQRAARGPACGVRGERLLLDWQGVAHDLGPIRAMPLSVGGSASYNIANLAGAALAAAGLGVPPATIASVFGRFGARATDNFGRMMRFERDGVRILIDYAHNPAGLRGLLAVAEHLRGGRGRLGLLLGHAGNRQDAEIEALAAAAAQFRPDLVVIKENEGHLRGRAPGEIPQVIFAALQGAGFPASALPQCTSELEGVRYALEWARPGDVLALPVHSATARAAVVALLTATTPPAT
jgi:cyanophycin synthetase